MKIFAVAAVRLSTWLVLFGVVVACSQQPQQSADEIEEVDLSVGGDERLHIPRQSREYGQYLAVDILLASANEAIKVGHYQRAAAYVERAIRMAPNDARAYFGLAQVHYYQNQPELGSSFLAKSESLALRDKALLKAIQKFRSQLP